MKLVIFFLIYVLNDKVLPSKIYPVSENQNTLDESDSEQQQRMDNPAGGVDVDTCPYAANYSTIIKTNESMADKAVFLEFRKGKTKEDCLQGCCSLKDCNLAVYENKNDQNCYLFNCGQGEKSRCHFAKHEGYMIMSLRPRQSSHLSQLSKLKQTQHENELEGLADQKPKQSPEIPPKVTAPPKVVTTPAPQKAEDPDAGQLYAECSQGLYCHDENAVCRGGICVCKSGYNSRYGTCRGTPHDEESLHQLEPPEGRDGRPPIRPYNTSATKHSHVPSTHAEAQELPALAALPASESKQHWAEDKPPEDVPKQLTKISEMREDTVDPVSAVQSHKQKTIPAEKKGKPNIPSGGQDVDGLAAPAIPQQRKPDVDGYHEAEPLPQAPVSRPLPGDRDPGADEEQVGKQGGPPLARPKPMPNYPNRPAARPRPYQISRRPGAMRVQGAGRQPVRQPDRQPLRQPNRQPVRQPVTPVRQPVRQPASSRSRFPYPYTGEVDRGQVAPYPVQYPSYEWDYRPDDYGGPFPDRGQDYNSPGALDQGVFDYPGYRQPSYYGPDEPPHNAQGKPNGNRPNVKPPKVSEPSDGGVVKPVPTTHAPAPTQAPTAAIPDPDHKPRQPEVNRTPAPQPGTTTATTTTTVLSTTTTGPVVTKAHNSTAESRAEEMGGGHEVAVEQIIIASPTDSAQGPIVALALGLAFTLMLLVFVGCRLRNVKRRIRKGRVLHSNEADYLINGMYL